MKGPPNTQAPARDLLPSIEGSVQRLAEIHTQLTEPDLSREADEHRARLSASLDDGTWIREFPGRLILRRFCDSVHGGGIDTTLYCNAVLDKMVESNVKPTGMATVITEIASR
ncbi:MAG: hypothetical protein QOD07_1626 [Frankiaceae bacterium]|nr:hypothetical protein [Frankiaceae bacterium]